MRVMAVASHLASEVGNRAYFNFELCWTVQAFCSKKAEYLQSLESGHSHRLGLVWECHVRW